MPQTAQQMSSALRGVSKDMKSRAAMAGDKGRRATTDVAAMRTAGAGRQYFKDELSLGTTVKNSAEKMRMFGQTAVSGMPGVRKGGLTDLMTRGKR
jgi:hypothetical protein